MFFKKYFEKRKEEQEERELQEQETNELSVRHYKGFERGHLMIISKDLEQLKELYTSLKTRGCEVELFEGIGGTKHWKVDLTPAYKTKIDTPENTINDYLKKADRFFVNGRPIPNYDFFTEEEKKILGKHLY